jgi:hypothetical protein
MGYTCEPSPLGFNTVHFGRTLKGNLPCELREFEVSITRRIVNGDSNMETFARFNWRIKYADFCTFFFSKTILCTLATGFVVQYSLFVGTKFFLRHDCSLADIAEFCSSVPIFDRPPRAINDSELTSDSSQSGHRSFAYGRGGEGSSHGLSYSSHEDPPH